MPAFDTPAPISVGLDLPYGDVSIIASERTDTVVTVAPRDLDKPGDVRAAEQTTVTFDDGTLTIRVADNWRRYTPFGGSESVDITVLLPVGSRVRGTLAVGNIRAEGTLGDAHLTSGIGDIVLDTVGSATLKTGTGDIVIGTITGASELTTSTGAARIDAITAPTSVKNTHGITSIGRVTDALTFKGAHGDTQIAWSTGTIIAKTGYGRLRVEQAAGGTVKLESSYGKFDVGIAPGTAAWLDVSSTRGRLHNSLTSESEPADGGASVEIHARTTWGDITIARAKGASS
jgi:DUF4097 and DUF4098 domain-containing protein YvlB